MAQTLTVPVIAHIILADKAVWPNISNDILARKKYSGGCWSQHFRYDIISFHSISGSDSFIVWSSSNHKLWKSIFQSLIASEKNKIRKRSKLVLFFSVNDWYINKYLLALKHVKIKQRLRIIDYIIQWTGAQKRSVCSAFPYKFWKYILPELRLTKAVRNQ